MFEQHGVQVYVKRDDLIHEEVSGNKWRKLKYNILRCREAKREGILTFGGAYSNHLVATAAACKELGFRSVGVVRGDELNPKSNETLKRCETYGMELHFVSREEYGMKNERMYHEDLMETFGNMFVVPEGGANYYGIIGCQEVMGEIETEIDAVFIAQGTTTSSCGVLMSLQQHQVLHAVPVLKGFDSKLEMETLFSRSGFDMEYCSELFDQLMVHDNYHFNGYGRYTNELLDFINDTYRKFGLRLDPVYTSKAFYALIDQVKEGNLDGKHILFIHTGGVQGTASIEAKENRSLHE